MVHKKLNEKEKETCGFSQTWSHKEFGDATGCYSGPLVHKGLVGTRRLFCCIRVWHAKLQSNIGIR